MEFERQLFFSQMPDITIEINLGFDGEDLRLVGYDFGKRVEEAWGDSDYEYEITVKWDGLIKLYEINNLFLGQKEQLVNTLAEIFTGNYAYSMFTKYLDKNKVKYESFTWT